MSIEPSGVLVNGSCTWYSIKNYKSTNITEFIETPCFYYRWLLYTPIGEPIAGTRLISFKVPLKEVSNFNFLLICLPSLIHCIQKKHFCVVILCRYTLLSVLNSTLNLIKIFNLCVELFIWCKDDGKYMSVISGLVFSSVGDSNIYHTVQYTYHLYWWLTS